VNNNLVNPSVIDIPLPSSSGDLLHDSKQGGSGVLAPGTTTIVPLWIRGDKFGKHVFKFLFGYFSEVS